MPTLVPMDSSGRLVLPKSVRDQLHLAGPAEFHVSVIAGRVELTPAGLEGRQALTDKDGIPVLARTGAPVDAAAAARGELDALADRGRPR